MRTGPVKLRGFDSRSRPINAIIDGIEEPNILHSHSVHLQQIAIFFLQALYLYFLKITINRNHRIT